MFETITATKIVGGGAIVGLAVSAWANIKTYLGYIWGILFVTVDIKGVDLKKAFYAMLRDDFKCMSFNKKSIQGDTEYVRPVKRNQLIAWIKINNCPTIWRKGFRFISTIISDDNLSVTFFRWQFDVKELTQLAINKFNGMNNKKNWKSGDRFRIIKKSGSIGRERDYARADKMSSEGKAVPIADCADGDNIRTATPIYWKLEDIGQPKKDSALSDLYYRDNVKEAIKEAFLWRDSEEWFKSRGIPWKRGFLLCGSPGCVTEDTKVRIRKISDKGKHIIHIENMSSNG